MKLINIGFGNMVSASKLVAIVSPESAPITYGRRTRAVIVMDSDHVILSSIQPETVANRVIERDDEDEDDEDE